MSLVRNINRRIKIANKILERLAEVKIEGIEKLRNKFKQEISFLQKCARNRKVKAEHLLCCNLTHLEALAYQMLKYETICQSVMTQKILRYENGTYKKMCIDLILCGGSVWMKVIARNRRALSLVARGEGAYGQKSVLDQGREFIECSKQNVCFFKPPIVTFFFENGIDCFLATDLTEMGIRVETDLPDIDATILPPVRRPLIDDDQPRNDDLNSLKDATIIGDLGIKKLNLGVTTMIAYVSALTNGGCYAKYHSDVLMQHAEWEKLRPVKRILDKLFEDKELYCCKTAVADFKGILEILGGPGEKQRAEELLKRVKIVDDHPTKKLIPGGKIKERSLAIFGTGEYLQAITVTANQGFIRSARNKGVTFEVFLHESRALTEGKELPQDLPEELPQDLPQDLPEEHPKELPQELLEEHPKELLEEHPKELPKELP